MATCPKGHESATLDYCDQCGAPMAGKSANGSGSSPVPAGPNGSVAPQAGPPPPAAGKPCPICGTPQAGRFCEEDGYDFLLAPPVPPSSTGPAGSFSPTGSPARSSTGSSPGGTALPASTAADGSSAAVAAGVPSAPDASGVATTAPLVVVVGVDRDYFEAVIGMGGEDAGGLTFPPFVVERRFRLAGQQLLIGRSSRSRGVHPEIDLGNPPEDPGVSHAHALLVARPDGWAVVDLESVNGTYVNDPGSGPIPAHTPVPVTAGDRIFVGAWTCLFIRAAN